MKKYLMLIFLITTFPFFSIAHEGHGHTHGFTITHYFVEPEHLATILAIFTLAFAYWKYALKKADK